MSAPLALGVLGFSPAAPSLSAGDRVRALRDAERGLDRALADLAREPSAQRAIAAFHAAVARSDTPQKLLSDPRTREFLARALGVPDAAQAPALVTRALLADPADPRSLVNQLSDRRLRAAAETLGFAAEGLARLRDPAIRESVVKGWVRGTHFERLRERSPELVDALVFKEQAAGVAGNVYAVLGHPVVRRVVTTTLGLPMELAVQSVEAQARAIQARLDVSRLADPKFVSRFAERFLLTAPSAAAVSAAPAAALAGGGNGFGLVL